MTPEDDALETIAVALTVAVGAATDRIAASVRALRPGESVEPASLVAMQTDVRALHAAVGHLRALHAEGDTVARPAPDLLDATAIAREVAEELQVEGFHVQVESAAEGLVFPGHAPEVRRILRWMIERASAADSAPWLRLQIVAIEGSVVFELPWPGDEATTTASAEREWLVHLIHQQAGTLSTQGFRARVSFPLELESRDVMRDPDALAREITSLREQRAAQTNESAAVLAQLRASQTELGLARMHTERFESTVRAASLDLQRTLEAIGGVAAALAERDPAGSDVQTGVQSALNRILLMLREAGLQAHETVESHVGPRVHTEEPDPIGELRDYASDAPERLHARTLPPSPITDPDEAEIPLAENI